MSFPGAAEAAEEIARQLELAAADLPAKRAYRVYREPTDVLDPPAVVVGPPEFAWEAGAGPFPRVGTWPVSVVVQGGTGEVSAQLNALLPVVSAALFDVVDAVVLDAEPTTYPAGAAELPAYIFRLEVAL